jgi:hypothetical protein
VLAQEDPYATGRLAAADRLCARSGDDVDGVAGASSTVRPRERNQVAVSLDEDRWSIAPLPGVECHELISASATEASSPGAGCHDVIA